MVEAIRWARENDLPVLRDLSRPSGRHHRVRPQRLPAPRHQQHRVRAQLRDPGHLAACNPSATCPTWAGPCGSGPTPPGCGPGPERPRPTVPTEISERHRHRWEVSNAYRDVLAEFGLRLSGQSPGRRAGRGHRAARSRLVHRLPVPSRAEVAAHPAPPALRRVHRGGACAAGPPHRREPRPRSWPGARADGAGPSGARRFSSPGPV